MEEHGRRNARHRPIRLLASLVAIASSFLGAAQGFAFDAGISVSSYELPVGGSLVLECTILNAEIENVSLDIAGLPASFVEIASRKERRLFQDSRASSVSAAVLVF